jgi:RimJ/RimL family protein N-acetyltransferase
MEMFLRDDGSLEKDLGIRRLQREVHPRLKESLKDSLLPFLDETPMQHYFIVWIMISKEHHCIAGEVFFKGTPCEDGSVEIGYGIQSHFAGKGLTTEAVEVLCAWALEQKYIRTILARTQQVNTPSQRVLQKNGFTCMGEKEEQCWQLRKKVFAFV